jgi:hypothetical protein
MINTSFGKGYRTLAINILSLLVLVLGGLTGQITDPNTLRYFAIALTVANVVLRWLTDGPVPSKGDSV